jgi:4'-phosphopantetheinyl transferase EntD
MIADLVPSAVVTYETREEIEMALAPEEAACLKRPGEKRRREFITGRACAHRALAQLGGLGEVSIACGEHREPLWPSGVVGSITHCRGYRACAVAWSRDVSSIGIDAEVAIALRPGVLESIASSRERRRLLVEDRALRLDKVLFCAKEAVFKAWFPLTETMLTFEDIDVSLDARERVFRAQLLVCGPRLNGTELTEVCGSWRVDAGIVITAAVLGA